MQTLLALYDHFALHSLKAQGYRSRYVDSSAGRVHVLEARGRGAHPPLVLLHGFSSCGSHFFPIAGRMRKAVNRLILPDMPAHGWSDTPRIPTAKGLERGLIEALDSVIDQPCVLFGLSMGGLAAIRYTLERRDRVRGLVLCSPGGAEMREDELGRLREAFHLPSHDRALAFVDKLFAKPSLLRHAYASGVRHKFGRASMRTLIASMRREDLLAADELRSLDLPTLLLWGRRDRILPQSSLEFFKTHLPSTARVVEPEGFGHSPFLEQPNELCQYLEDFLETTFAPRATLPNPNRGLMSPKAPMLDRPQSSSGDGEPDLDRAA